MKTEKKGGLRLPSRYLPWANFALACILASLSVVIVRMVQLNGSVNFATGFYSGSSSLMIFLNLLLILFGLLLWLMTWADRTEYQTRFSASSRTFVKWFFLILCAAFILQGFYELYGMMIAQTRDVGLLEILSAATAILAGFGFLFGAFTVQQPRNTPIDVLYGFPCLWACVVLIQMFVKHTVVITVSESLFNILRMIFLMVFLLASSKYLAGYSDVKNEHWLVFTGSMSVVFGALTTLPLLLVLPFGKQYTASHIVQAGPLDFLLTLYAAAIVLFYLRSRRRMR